MSTESPNNTGLMTNDAGPELSQDENGARSLTPIPERDVQITDHALERWDERTPWWSVSHEEAWDNGATVRFLDEFFADKWGNKPHELRYFTEEIDPEFQSEHSGMMEGVSHKYSVVIPQRYNCIRTVINVSDIYSRQVRAYLAELESRVGWENKD